LTTPLPCRSCIPKTSAIAPHLYIFRCRDRCPAPEGRLRPFCEPQQQAGRCFSGTETDWNFQCTACKQYPSGRRSAQQTAEEYRQATVCIMLAPLMGIHRLPWFLCLSRSSRLPPNRCGATTEQRRAASTASGAGGPEAAAAGPRAPADNVPPSPRPAPD